MKTPSTSKLACISKAGILMLALLAASKSTATAADITWIGGTDSYTNPAAWTGGVVPGPLDNAINDNTSNNVVQINSGNPDWTVNQIRAGNGAGDGAFVQNGQAVTLVGTNNGTAYTTPFRLGVAAGDTGIYTLNGGSINYSNGPLNVGELGTGILNVAGGSVTGTGNIAINSGGIATPNAVNATVGNGTTEGDYTWFEQGYYAANGAVGLPAAGSSITSVSQADHSFNLPPSYTANNSVMVAANLTSATITTAPSVCSALSILCTAGNGATTVNYIVHHADSTIQTGSLTIPDWFGPSSANEVMAVGARVDALGKNFQFPAVVSPFTGNAPYLWSLDISQTNTTSAVTSIDVTYVSGGVANIFAVSSSTGAAFSPVSITGFNKDVVVEVGAQSFVSGSVTDIFNQNNGSITINGGGQFFVGNNGTGIYNLSGGTFDVHNYVAIGRSSGNGTMNMTGGTFNQDGGGDFLIGTGFNNNGNTCIGVLNQNGGTINSQGSVLVPESSPSTGTYNFTNGTLVVNNWIAVGRNGGTGIMNLAGGTVSKTGNGGNHIVLGAGGPGTINQSGGYVVSTASDTWIGENGAGTWNFNGGTNTLSAIHIAQTSGNGTLNLNGGLLTVGEITTGNPASVSILNFNGSVVQASATTVNFIHDVFSANVQPGGAVFDSAGFDITVAQPLADGGGGAVTKNGLGTLTLNGANSYSGQNIVNGGKLITSTDSAGNGDFTVANGAGFGVNVHSLNAQYTVANGSFASTATTLNFDLGPYGNPTSAPLNLSSTLTVNGTVTISVADALPQLGQFPLVKYVALSGSGSFVLGSLPTGVTASISNNVANSSIDLVITGVNQPRWEGLAGGDWDIGLTTNWINIGTALPTFYTDGSPVTFNDSAAGSTTVNLATTVHPNSITLTNSTLNYTFVGSGSIAGSIGLNKQGGATVSLLNNNTYTGPTVVNGGILSVTNLLNGGLASPIGASSANPTNLVINSGATFQYAGAPVTVNRGYTANSGNIDAEGDLTLTGLGVTASGTLKKVGPGKLTYAGTGNNVLSPANVGGAYQANNGTVVVDGSAGGTASVTGELWVGGTPATGGNMILTNTTMTVGSWLGLGRGNGTINNTSSLSLYNSRVTFGNVSLGYANGIAGNLARMFLTLAGASSITNSGDMNLCESAGSTATISISGTSVLYGQNRFFLPNGGGATGAVTVADSGRMIINNGWFSIGNGNGGNGSVTLNDNSFLRVSSDLNVTDTGTSVGSLSLSGNALATGNAVYVGKSSGSVGTLTVSGGTLIARSGDLQMGASGNATCNQTGGTVIGTNWISIGRNSGGTAVYNISGGSLIKVFTGNGTRLNVAENGTGTLNVSGTANVYLPICWLDICSANGNGTINLNGGTITCQQVTHLGAGTATFNFNGGTLVAGVQGGPNLMSGLTSANVLAGGAIVDSGTNVVAIGNALLDGGGGGGLTKLGSGTLRLNGASTYTGPTLVSTGTLGGTGSLLSPVTIASGATLSPGAGGIGNLTVNTNVTLLLGSTNLMEINKTTGTNDLLTGVTTLNYGGTLSVSLLAGLYAPGDTFKLFNATTYNGSFNAITPAIPAPGYAWNTSQLAVNGTLSVVATANQTPTNLVAVVSGGNLNLSWPSDHTGWRLQIQTNALSAGLKPATNAWSTVAGSTFTNAMSIPINPINPAVFLRMTFP